MRFCLFMTASCAVGCAPVEDEPVAPVELTWDTELRADTLGFEPDAAIAGHTLGEIVSGAVDARGEGRSCTVCHFDGSVTFYRPELAQGDVRPIGPYDVVDGRTWAGNNGWGAFFTTMGPNSFAEKPADLRDAFALFLAQEAERVVPLGWSDPMTAENLGVTPDPDMAGRVLAEVIGSRQSARADGLMCADCHYVDGPVPYRPAIARGDASTTFTPDQLVDGRSWSGPDGWAVRFAASGPNAPTHKPDPLRAMFFKWNDDGAL